MKHHEIEAWALEIVDRAKAGQQIEDARVELKTELIAPERVARRLAAHANAARGAPILWIVGVDEDAQAVTGCDRNEYERWWQQVEARFDGVAPDVTGVVVPIPGDPAVLALQFDTVRRPFVVRSARQDNDRLEVPWRGSASTRSARRAELVQLLSEVVPTPRFSVLSGSVTATPLRDDPGESHWSVGLRLYVEVPFETAVVVPDHQVTGELVDQQTRFALSLGGASLNVPLGHGGESISPSRRPTSLMYTAHRGFEQTVITGPGIVFARAVARERADPPPPRWLIEELTVRFEVTPIGAASAVVIEAPLLAETPQHREAGRWTVGAEPT